MAGRIWLPFLNAYRPAQRPAKSAISLLIADVGLPCGMNGRQIVEAARFGRPELEVLFMTDYAENAVLDNGHLDPGIHIITEPFQMDAFARRVKDLISRH